MSLFMKTTQISSMKTVSEIQVLLASTGFVEAIRIDYEKGDGQVKAISFVVDVEGEQVPFKLPAKVGPVFEVLQRERSPRCRTKQENIQKDTEQAVRTAWRQILRWVQAQIALIETGMVEVTEVFMPYVQLGVDQTMHDRFLKSVKNGQLALPVPQ